MSWLQRLKENFSKRRIRQLDRSRKYLRDFVDIEHAKEIGMIVNANQCSTEDLKILRNYIDQLKRAGKSVFLIEINFLKKSVPEFANTVDSVFINPSKLNWLDFPIQSVESQIKQHNLDILIDFDVSDRMTSKYLLSMANAKTRVGAHVEGFENCYEVMVDLPPQGNPMQDMIKQFDYFLKMLEK